MTKQIGNFSISEGPDKIVVDYKKSVKDSADTLFTITIGVALSVVTFFLLRYGYNKTSYVILVSGVIVAFQAVLQLASALSRLLQPTRNLLIIDKNARTLLSRQNPFRIKSLSIDSIEALLTSGKKENVLGKENRLMRTFCTVEAKLTNKTMATLFTINSNRFFRTSEQKLETELYLTAKRLTTELNKYLKAKYQWTGYDDL